MRAPLFFFVLAACASAPPGPITKNQPSVTLIASDGASVKVEVEIADTPAARNRGLMQRAALADNAGMLFLFPREEMLSFWMKDTLIPLDMIFIRADLSVAGIVENAEPLTLGNRGVGVASQFVLEVNGGYAKKHGLSAGNRVHFEGVPAPPKR